MARFDYEPFGLVTQATGSQAGERQRFTGKPEDATTGLHYFNARYYDPEVGRFTSVDPAGDGLNLYVYARSNPLRLVDPTGLWGEEIHYGSELWGGTYYWALMVGFSRAEAEIVARACQGVDAWYNLKNPVFGQDYHFNTNVHGEDSRDQRASEHFHNAVVAWLDAGRVQDVYPVAAQHLREQALTQLGISLHPLQDKFAHADEYVTALRLGPVTVYHHLNAKGEGADSPRGYDGAPNPRLEQTLHATIQWLISFRRMVGLQ